MDRCKDLKSWVHKPQHIVEGARTKGPIGTFYGVPFEDYTKEELLYILGLLGRRQQEDAAERYEMRRRGL